MYLLDTNACIRIINGSCGSLVTNNIGELSRVVGLSIEGWQDPEAHTC